MTVEIVLGLEAYRPRCSLWGPPFYVLERTPERASLSDLRVCSFGRFGSPWVMLTVLVGNTRATLWEPGAHLARRALSEEWDGNRVVVNRS